MNTEMPTAEALTRMASVPAAPGPHRIERPHDDSDGLVVVFWHDGEVGFGEQADRSLRLGRAVVCVDLAAGVLVQPVAATRTAGPVGGTGG